MGRSTEVLWFSAGTPDGQDFAQTRLPSTRSCLEMACAPARQSAWVLLRAYTRRGLSHSLHVQTYPSNEGKAAKESTDFDGQLPKVGM